MDANAENTTLRQVLTQQKPFVSCDRKAAGRLRRSQNHKWPDLENVTIWEDFNYDTLNDSYGFILNRPVSKQLLVSRHPNQVLTGLFMTSSDSARNLITWNDEQIRATLGFAKNALGLRKNSVLSHRSSTPNGSSLAKLSHWGKRLAIDHVVMLEGGGRKQSLIVGIGKTSSAWNSSKVTHGLGSARGPDEGDWLLRQLANTCKIADTRYGYIQTDDELVACRFAKKDGGGSQDSKNWRVELMPVPWAASGVNMLTTELALWWLCMLGIADDAAITEEDNMVRINSWDTIFLDDERGWVRRHQYSRFEEPTNAPSPPAYRTPTPRNTAAFTAAIGLHALPEFEIHDHNAANTANDAINNPHEVLHGQAGVNEAGSGHEDALLQDAEQGADWRMDWSTINFDDLDGESSIAIEGGLG